MVVRASDTDPIAIPAALQRGVLAILLSRANLVVSRDELAETLWDGQNPGTARTTLAAYVSRLRRVLGPDAGRRIGTRPPGYVIEIDAEEYDCARAGDLHARARAAAERGDWAAVQGLAADGLRLWRGTPYQDVPVPRLHREDAAALDAVRVQLTELTVEADLRLGRGDSAISTLMRLTEQEPLRESFSEKLMMALAAQGRRAEALAVFHRARKVLRENLGIDPGPDLARAHHDVLAASGGDRPASAAASAAAASATGSAAASPERIRVRGPRQLPPAARHFTGREAELAAMDEAAASGEVLVVSGLAGVGKTALTTHWAHQAAPRYPDGQVFVGLHGFDPHSVPMTAHTACSILLESLGLATSEIPADPDARTALYRTVVAGRRLLLVLDDAWDAAQIRPLIPGTAGSQVVVTSRNRLAGLVAADGARPILLAPLDNGRSMELLARRSGIRPRPDEPADTAAAEALAAACAGLPLALTIAAARLQLDPDLSWSALTERLHDRRGALSTLDVGEASGSLRAVFSMSYQRLSRSAAALFRLLGIHPGPDIAMAAAVSLAGSADTSSTEQALEELLSASLLHRHAGRFRFHDLVRAYAAETALEDSPEVRTAARVRIHDHCLRSAIEADRMLRPTREPLSLPAPVPDVRPESFADVAAATAWFQEERQVLAAVVALASREQDDEYAHRLPWAISTYLNRRGEWPALAELHLLGAEAADRTGDPRARARTHTDASSFLLQILSFDEARRHLELSMALWQELGDLRGAWLSEHNMGHLCHKEGRHAEAAEHARRALEHARARGWAPDVALALSTAAWSLTHCDDHAGALLLAAEAIELDRCAGDRNGEAHAYDTVGLASFRLGRYPEALAAYHKALRLFEDLGDIRFRGRVLMRIGQVRRESGETAAAHSAWSQALKLFEQVGAPESDELREMLDGLDGSDS
ncbi:transcriptional regulator, SARP family [Catenulispora acidiphila DSM 44928]|uniref:Transcriptional regulator, SARP family n=2 Tax=Catenulispora TaxID=414878 RepID=C7QDR7_CATAD|nr:transcriptional regulator, SARP family [Catenulispora acidiphila DSM 44928]